MGVFVRWVSRLAFVPLALAATWLLLGGLTVSGTLYVLAPVLAVGGLAAPAAPARWATQGRRVAAAAAVAFALTLAFRLVGAHSGRRLTMHGGTPLGTLVDEGDLAITASRAIVLTGFLPRGDTTTLVADMRTAYAREHDDEGSFPSPAADTYLLGDAGTITIEPPPEINVTTSAVVFLHGFAGSFTLPCWQMARAAERIDAVTVCPATSWRGHWWSAAGERTLRRVVDDLHTRGIRDIVLVGLSNGGVGATQLVSRFPRGTFRALVAISGADASAPPPGVPTLVVQGSADGMMPDAVARAYAARAHAQLLELRGGTHFVLVERPETCERAIGDFLVHAGGGYARQRRETSGGPAGGVNGGARGAPGDGGAAIGGRPVSARHAA